MEAKFCLLDIYNDILATGVVPQSWHRTKVVPIIVKFGRDPLLSGLSRPISMLACGRKLMKKMIMYTAFGLLGRKEWHIVSFSVWFQKRIRYAILSSDVDA
jgi:hypothetical protein